MPPWTFIAAQIVRATTQALAMAALLLLIGAVAYGVPIPGSTFPAFVFYVVIGTATMCSLGIALSSFTPNADAASTIAPFTVVMLSFFSGVWIPVEQLPQWLETVGKIFPLYHLALGLQTSLAPGASGSGLTGENVAGAGDLGRGRRPHRQHAVPLGAAVRYLGGEALFGAGSRLCRLDLAVLRRRRRDQAVEQLPGRLDNRFDRLLEGLGVRLGGLGRAADLAHVLQRRRLDLVLGRGWIEIVEGPDISAHEADSRAVRPVRQSPWERYEILRRMQGGSS